METKNDTKNIQFKYLDLVTVAFTVILILSNFGSSAKIIDWGFSIGNVPLAFDAGTLFFPFAYIFGDVLTEVYGYAKSRRVIWIGFASLIFTFLMFLLIRYLPGEASWLEGVGQKAFDDILSGISGGGIILASVSGYLLGSFSNSMIMAVMKNLTKSKHLWLRTIASTIVGEFLDTIVFVLIASATGVFPWELFWSLVLTNYIFKITIEALFTPATYWITKKLKKAEGVEVYSDLKDLNPLSF
ncbi:MAG: queuosine precursor transporter [Anaerolineaceae bacterium]|nr:queuosine precursor transporter [Anaerolineaceae bacterium]